MGCIALVSCDREDPALLQKKNDQAKEIIRLKGEILILEEKVQNMPPDVSAELETRRKEIASQEAAIKDLEANVKELEQRKLELQREFDAYKGKYRLQP